MAVIAMVGSAACWGFGSVVSKAALNELAPGLLLVVQLATSSFILWLFVFLTGSLVQLNRSARIAAAAGVLEPGVAYSLGTLGLTLTSASIASTIGATEPLIILLLAAALLKERILPRHVLGTLGIMLGLVLIANPVESAVGEVLGMSLVIGGTVTAAFYVLLSAKYSVDTPASLSAARQQSVGLVFALILYGLGFLFTDYSTSESLSIKATILAIASGAIQYALAFWLYLWGLKHLSVSEAGLFLALIPVFGIFGGAFFLDEMLGWFQLCGAGVIVVTLAMTMWRSSRG